MWPIPTIRQMILSEKGSRSRVDRVIRRHLPSRILAALALLICAGPLAGPAGADDAIGPTVLHTESGLVSGASSGTDRSFQNIPYAAPPVGPLRWQPPRPALPWLGVRDATHPGNACPQPSQQTLGGPLSTTEDCLGLNVYAPRSDVRGLPVVVFIHGGYMVTGSGRDYSAHRLEARGDVVTVTINYRLGALGGLSLAGATPGGIAGDYGIQDQQAALRWVQRNIAAFGGDPGRVTIDGQSAGAVSVCSQLDSPLAAGLFQRADIQSAPCVGDGFGPWPDRDQTDQQGVKFAAAVGCTDPGTLALCLRTKPVDALLTAQAPYMWLPTIDGRVLPLQPREAITSGRFNHVPVMISNTRDEERLFVLPQYGLGTPLTAAAYPKAISDFFGPAHAPAILERYPLRNYDQPVLAYAAARSDFDYICGVPTTAGLLSRTVPTYAAEFADEHAPGLPGLPKASYPLGAAHAFDLPYVYETSDVTPAFTADQQKLSDDMIGYLTAFAATGNPNGGGRPEAPRFDSGNPAYLHLIPQGPHSYTDFATEHQCGFWDSYITW